MTDVHSRKQRSYNMSQIKGKDTKPEITVRKWLWNNGYRYRLHRKDLPGKPDIVFPGKKKVIFVNGCFWHKHDCEYFKWPKSNSDFWYQKISKNVLRDTKSYEQLRADGWNILIVWECEIKKKDLTSIYNKLTDFLDS
ncbi:very short patch repair endonuclease [Methanolobus bombayensis]|uniref:very short patch repair endonuclease n=1 Tax=Methanolobus bombayensis TaxID=38023 RepID=UPI001AE71256|nr:very short patch repair endonuclease [Methanolobus bombayensis]MBP1910326.1 DNA mismatch endonuclease (patch repair protein) [Methanolobus bombayensis]